MTDTTHGEQQKKHEAAAKQQIAAAKSAREREATAAPTAGKPTPTQDENDLAALGVHVLEKEPDGSPETGPIGTTQDREAQTRQSEARKPGSPSGGYQTRATQASKAE